MYQRTKIAVAVTLAISTMAVYAQEAAPAAEQQPLQRVEVTGSRIRQVDLETAQPVLTMTAEQIQKTGLVNVGDILNNLSSAGNPAFSKGSVLTSNREMGGQYVNLRNLGSQRLLVLVNGKRWSQTVAGYTDLSTIPSSMIERMDILKDGASSTYGSDAIAGVINIILKKNLDQATVSAYRGANEAGDGDKEMYYLNFGAGDEKANVMFGLSHSSDGTVWARDREITRYSGGPNHPTSSLVGGPWGRIRQVSATGGPTGFDNILNHTGDQENPGVGEDSRNPANYHPYTGAPADLYQSARDMMFQAPNELTNLFTRGTVQLPHEMQLSTTALFSTRRAHQTVAGYPASSLMQSKNPVYIDKDSYYNPYGNQVAGAGNGQDLYFYRRTMEVPRTTNNKNQTLHVDMTLEGEFNVGSSPFNWSVGVNHSSVNGSTLNTGNLNLVTLKKALGPSFMNADGQVQCGTAAKPIALSECVPFNILGGPSASTPQALNYVMAEGKATYGSTVNSVTADISGEVFQLPAGGLGVAAGVEKREVSGYDRPDQMDQMALTSSLAGKSTLGEFDVKEAYLETNIPLLKGLPFAELLSINLASRYSDYSNFGSTTNSKASFMYRPIKDVLVRGTFAEGFRAPTVGDTFGGGSQSFDTYLDPCDSLYGRAATDPAVMQRCLASGVPVGFRQKNSAGNPIPSSSGGQTPFPFSTGAGNDSLQPETATTRTLGLVYSPAAISGLTVALDWYDIRVQNRIVGVSAGYILGECYVNNATSFCDDFVRDASGQIVDLRRGNANLGQVNTEGYDFDLNYRFPATAFGKFNLRSQTTYLHSYMIQSTATATPTEYAGEHGLPRVKSNIMVDWSLGNWNATYGIRATSHVKTACWNATTECSNPEGGASYGRFNRLPAQVWSDISVGYKFAWDGRLTVGVNNVFDKKPRVNYSAAASATPVDADVPLDRFIWVRYNQNF